ncbi:hypothetical protein [Streptomyces canus]|uniref:hypothetical protein n=1 Tax=Streptomyces canus TaxID=58343 RepID=UPI00324FCD0D
MRTLTPLVFLLLFLEGLTIFGVFTYVAHTYSRLVPAIMVGLAGLALMTAVVDIIVSR